MSAGSFMSAGTRVVVEDNNPDLRFHCKHKETAGIPSTLSNAGWGETSSKNKESRKHRRDFCCHYDLQ